MLSCICTINGISSDFIALELWYSGRVTEMAVVDSFALFSKPGGDSIKKPNFRYVRWLCLHDGDSGQGMQCLERIVTCIFRNGHALACVCMPEICQLAPSCEPLGGARQEVQASDSA